MGGQGHSDGGGPRDPGRRSRVARGPRRVAVNPTGCARCARPASGIPASPDTPAALATPVPPPSSSLDGGRSCSRHRHRETGSAGQPLSLVALAAKVAESEVETLELAEPALPMSPAATSDEVRLELVEATDHGRADVEHRAADTRVLMYARGPIGSPATAELHLPLVEVLLELTPIGVGRRSV